MKIGGSPNDRPVLLQQPISKNIEKKVSVECLKTELNEIY